MSANRSYPCFMRGNFLNIRQPKIFRYFRISKKKRLSGGIENVNGTEHMKNSKLIREEESVKRPIEEEINSSDSCGECVLFRSPWCLDKSAIEGNGTRPQEGQRESLCFKHEVRITRLEEILIMVLDDLCRTKIRTLCEAMAAEEAKSVEERRIQKQSSNYEEANLKSNPMVKTTNNPVEVNLKSIPIEANLKKHSGEVNQKNKPDQANLTNNPYRANLENNPFEPKTLNNPNEAKTINKQKTPPNSSTKIVDKPESDKCEEETKLAMRSNPLQQNREVIRDKKNDDTPRSQGGRPNKRRQSCYDSSSSSITTCYKFYRHNRSSYTSDTERSGSSTTSLCSEQQQKTERENRSEMYRQADDQCVNPASNTRQVNWLPSSKSFSDSRIYKVNREVATVSEVRRSESVCNFCKDKNLNILENAVSHTVGVFIGAHNPLNVSLAVNELDNQIYHLRIIGPRNEHLGCILATENALMKAKVDGLFERYLSFFVLKSNNLNKAKQNFSVMNIFEIVDR